MQGILKAGIYIVGTPIGNLSDLSPRAVEILKSCDVIACEDTRVTGVLAQRFDINTQRISMHDHNEREVFPKIIERVQNGEAVAVVSDSGMPMISDPGFRLVRAAREADLYITVIPGPTAVISALCLSGFPTDKFYFGGFLPEKSMARAKALRDVLRIPGTIVFYESPNRLEDSLRDMAVICPERKVAVVREITKLYEETKIDLPAGLIHSYSRDGWPRGEIVLVIEPAADIKLSDEEIREIVQDVISSATTSKDAAVIIAERARVSKNEAYDLVLREKQG